MNKTNVLIKKDQVLKISAELFKDKGYYAVKFQDIAEQIGCNTRSIKHFFKTKLNIFKEIFELHYQESAKNVFKAMDTQVEHNKSPFEIIYKTLYAISQAHSYSPVFYNDVEKLIANNEEFAEFDKHHVDTIIRTIHTKLSGKTADDIDLDIGVSIVYKLIREVSRTVCHLPIMEQQNYLQELSKMIAGYLFA